MSERGSIGPAGGLDLVDEGERGTKDNSHHEWMGFPCTETGKARGGGGWGGSGGKPRVKTHYV